MPLVYLHGLTSATRTERANRHVARFLAFIAGAVNAGGFLALRQYTSHMSGIVSSMADDLAIGHLDFALAGLAAVATFLAGAMVTTLMVRWARRRRMQSRYALPLLLEAALLVLFGVRGRVFTGASTMEIVLLLCFTMGLQNAIITKLSHAVIRTTHLTGMITDSGIALGRMLDRLWSRRQTRLTRELATLRLLSSLVVLFFVGGVVGALGFKHVGFLFTLPLAAVLILLAAGPIVTDVKTRLRPRVPSSET
jgi:uncharacterized membrane protein YoaK (UPF0700 family)